MILFLNAKTQGLALNRTGHRTKDYLRATQSMPNHRITVVPSLLFSRKFSSLFLRFRVSSVPSAVLRVLYLGFRRSVFLSEVRALYLVTSHRSSGLLFSGPPCRSLS